MVCRIISFLWESHFSIRIRAAKIIATSFEKCCLSGSIDRDMVILTVLVLVDQTLAFPFDVVSLYHYLEMVALFMLVI